MVIGIGKKGFGCKMIKRKRATRGKLVRKTSRKTGYYWIKISNGQNSRWVIGKWWQSMQWFDTMCTIREKGQRDKIVEIDERRIINPNI